MNDYVNRTVGVQGGQGGNGHLTDVFSCRIIGGVLQLQHVSMTNLLSILHTYIQVSSPKHTPLMMSQMDVRVFSDHAEVKGVAEQIQDLRLIFYSQPELQSKECVPCTRRWTSSGRTEHCRLQSDLLP